MTLWRVVKHHQRIRKTDGQRKIKDRKVREIKAKEASFKKNNLNRDVDMAEGCPELEQDAAVGSDTFDEDGNNEPSALESEEVHGTLKASLCHSSYHCCQIRCLLHRTDPTDSRSYHKGSINNAMIHHELNKCRTRHDSNGSLTCSEYEI